MSSGPTPRAAPARPTCSVRAARVPHRASRLRGRSAVTLVELALVLTVLALLSGLTMVSLGGLTDSQRDAATARLRTAVIHAQLWALESGRGTWVTFDVGADRAEAFVELPTAARPRVALVDPHTRSALVVDLAALGLGIDAVDIGGTDEVGFDAAGAPLDAAGRPLASDGAVRLTGGRLLRIARGTGLVTVE